MLSFLNTVTSSGNGKTGSSGDTNKGCSGGETSGDDNRRSCNGGTAAGKKRKKGKQPAPQPKPPIKMTATAAGVAAAAAATTTNKLEPLGITISITPEKPKDIEDKLPEIPNLDSPLFKDVPSKKIESSSDSSSSSGGTSSSEDSSTSDDDSDDDEDEKKDAVLPNNNQKSDVVEEPPKARTPIKLTISNVGKPSAKVTSTASREVISSNSSDSDTDVEDMDKCDNPLKMDTLSMDKPYHNHNMLKDGKNDKVRNAKLGMDVDFKNKGKSPIQNHLEWKNLCETTNLKGNCKDSSLLLNNENAAEDILRFRDQPTVDCSKVKEDVEQEDTDYFQQIEDVLRPMECMNNTLNQTNNLDYKAEEITPAFSLPCKESMPVTDMDTKPEEIKALYVPDNSDGCVLSASMGKSPQHLKPIKALSANLVDDLPACKAVSCEDAFSSETSNRFLAEKMDSSDVDAHHSIVNNSNIDSDKNFLIKTISNDLTLPYHKENEPPREEAHSISDSQAEVKDLNLNIKMSNSNENGLEAACLNKDADLSNCEKISLDEMNESSSLASVSCDPKVAVPKVKEVPVTSLPSPVSTKSSQSGNAPSTVPTKSCTNGIPDSENPFITWTKYDDDNSTPLPATLPASSLVRALAGASFPPLPLPVDGTVPQISPLGGPVAQLSPLGLAGLPSATSQLRMSPVAQIPRLTSPGSQRLRLSPSHSSQQMSPPLSHTSHLSSPLGHASHLSSNDSTKVGQREDSKGKVAPKSVKRTSRLSNIIDSLRTSKEKQIVSTQATEPSSREPNKKSTLDALLGAGRKSPTLTPPSAPTGHKQSMPPSSSPAYSPSLCSDQRTSADKLFRESMGFPHQISPDTRHAIRNSLDAARAQAVNNSFNALKDGLDKGKRMLENLELMNNGLMDPYSKIGPTETKSRKVEQPSQVQNRVKSSLPSLPSSSSSPAATSAPSSSSRPLSRQSSKQPSSYQTSSPSTSSTRSASVTTTSNTSGISSNSINSVMFQAAPSAALAAAHMELNAAAANILAFQHMYGMQDPYMMKTLMSNPLYLQRLMEFQKQAMDPLMLRQLEMFEAAAAAEKNKNNKDQRAAMNAQSLLWQAQAASILQHQQMQQLQQLQLHHQQQQFQQQAAAVRERETRETIAAIMASKSNSLGSGTSKSSGSISTGQSAKSLMASASLSSSSSSSSLSSNKRPRPVVPPSPSDLYSRDGSSLEKKSRPSQPSSSHVSNHNYHSSSSSVVTNSSSLSSSSSSASAKNTPVTSKSASSSGSSSNMKQRSSSSSGTSGTPGKHEFLDLSAALQLSAAPAPGLWGFPGVLQPPSVDMARMSRFFERPGEAAASSAPSGTHPEPEASGAEVLDLSVKPRTGKT
ncbi:uncharacterized protein LOC106074815 isoform X2 [Biomphalaria glabrata]|uniref:Uncharacterized protein LOC106074815 isoform X2 n=1 Tax=Biomphalaria glabrata TaxID=6526 RepID=A0A9U8EKS3_BIOGL|nr:uncharacterized protein LOC106074815 isoform X2 [Biomphalaria glabrata]